MRETGALVDDEKIKMSPSYVEGAQNRRELLDVSVLTRGESPKTRITLQVSVALGGGSARMRR
jgi:hypothetical protein